MVFEPSGVFSQITSIRILPLLAPLTILTIHHILFTQSYNLPPHSHLLCSINTRVLCSVPPQIWSCDYLLVVFYTMATF